MQLFAIIAIRSGRVCDRIKALSGLFAFLIKNFAQGGKERMFNSKQTARINSMESVVITGAARTPMGGFQGVFAEVNAPTLGGAAVKAALAQAQIETVDELLMGCVLPAGQGQAPARQAGFLAGLGEEVPATTLNKMCGSGMKTAMIAYDQIALGAVQVVVAGGMESMTNAPYLMPKMRAGARIGHQTVQDSMFLDGLEDAYDKGRLMGTFAEDCA